MDAVSIVATELTERSTAEMEILVKLLTHYEIDKSAFLKLV